MIHAPLVIDPGNKRGVYAHLTRGLFFRKGSRAAELDARVFTVGDVVATGRTGFDAFTDSTLHAELRRLGVERVFIAGFATDQCALKTYRTALSKGFDAYLVADCCATFLQVLQRRAERAAGERAIGHTGALRLAETGF